MAKHCPRQERRNDHGGGTRLAAITGYLLRLSINAVRKFHDVFDRHDSIEFEWPLDAGRRNAGCLPRAARSSRACAVGSDPSLAVSASCQLSDMRRRYTRYFCNRAGIILLPLPCSESRRVTMKRISFARCLPCFPPPARRVLRPGEEYNY